MGKRNKFRVFIPIDCGVYGEPHYIGISKKGRIGFLNHPHIPYARWDAWADMGGTVPMCIRAAIDLRTILSRDRGHGADRINWLSDPYCPPGFREFALNCIEARRVRRAIREQRPH
jgi:hypothetical protein